jgi:hypothetical protein
VWITLLIVAGPGNYKRVSCEWRVDGRWTSNHHF